MSSHDQSLQRRDGETRSATENQKHKCAAAPDSVIPDGAKDLRSGAGSRSFASLRMAIRERKPLPFSRLHQFLDLAFDQVALQGADVRNVELAVQVIGLMEEGSRQQVFSSVLKKLAR